MIVVDTSALVAVAKGEPGRAFMMATMRDADRLVMAAPSYVELGLVLGRLRSDRDDYARETVRDADVEVVIFDERLAERAIRAWHEFGRGNHPARLNLGDCFTYALAADLGYPILCTGDDFAQTDLPTLRPPA